MAWMYKFSLNHAKKFKILSFRRNLYTLSGQALLEFSVLTYIMADQLINILIEKYYTDLGPSGVFQCWWTFHLLEKITFLFLKNLWIYHSSKDFHELHGHYGKSFPGCQKPRFMGKRFLNFIVILFTIALEMPMLPKQKKDVKPATRIKIVVEEVNAVENIIKIEC